VVKKENTLYILKVIGHYHDSDLKQGS